MGLGNPSNETAETKSSKLVRHLARGDCVGLFAQQERILFAQVTIGEPLGEKTKEQQRQEQGQHSRVAETHSAGTPPINFRRLDELAKRRLIEGRVVAELLDVQETSVGVKADLPEGRQVVQPATDAKISCVGDSSLRSQHAAFLVILFDPRDFVVDMEAGYDVASDDACAKSARRVALHAAIENQ